MPEFEIDKDSPPTGPGPDDIKCGLHIRGREKCWSVDCYMTAEQLHCMQDDDVDVMVITGEIPCPEADAIRDALRAELTEEVPQ